MTIQKLKLLIVTHQDLSFLKIILAFFSSSSTNLKLFTKVCESFKCFLSLFLVFWILILTVQGKRREVKGDQGICGYGLCGLGFMILGKCGKESMDRGVHIV